MAVLIFELYKKATETKEAIFACNKINGQMLEGQLFLTASQGFMAMNNFPKQFEVLVK